jgi:hypothetical protein
MATKTTTKSARASRKTGQRNTAKVTPNPTKAKTKAKIDNGKKLGALDAAARVLGETGQAMNCRDLIEQMAAKGYWTSPGGATPWSTLNAAISREIALKGKDSRFAKPERGKFARA